MAQQVFGLSSQDRSALGAPPAARLAPAGNLGAALNALLEGFGVERAATRETTEDVVAGVLSRRGHDARVAELRWGRLVLEAPPAAARLLEFDRDLLLDELALAVPGHVEQIHIRAVR